MSSSFRYWIVLSLLSIASAALARTKTTEVVIWQDGVESAIVAPIEGASEGNCDIETSCPQEDLFLQKFGPRVTFRGAAYDVSRLGVYRFSSPVDGYFRTLVHHRAEYPPMTILRAITNLHVHGEPTVPMPFDINLLVRTTPYAVLTCGNVAMFAARIFTQLQEREGLYKDLSVRFVHTCIHPAVTPTGYNDGHVLLEISNDQKNWVLVDLDAGIVFRDRRTGDLFDAQRFFEAIQRDERPELVRLGRKIALVDPMTQYGGYFYAPEFNVYWNDDAELWKWYRRVSAIRSSTGNCPPDETPKIKALREKTVARAAVNAEPRRAPGSWSNVPFEPSIFTSTTGSWTVEPGDVARFAYTTIGKTMILNLNLDYTSVKGSPQYLQVKIPGGYKAVSQQDAILWAKDGDGTWTSTPAMVFDDSIRVFRRDYMTGWADANNTTHLRATITFELQ